MCIYDLLNGPIDSSELLYLIGFSIINHCLRKNNVFRVTSTSFFPRALFMANLIMDHVDSFFMSRNVFRQNVYIVSN